MNNNEIKEKILESLKTINALTNLMFFTKNETNKNIVRRRIAALTADIEIKLSKIQTENISEKLEKNIRVKAQNLERFLGKNVTEK